MKTSTAESISFKGTSHRLRQNIKKDSIKLKNKPLVPSSKRPKSKENKKRRRPRSHEDRKKKKPSYLFDQTTGKRSESRGTSEKANKEHSSKDTFKRRNIVNKFVNNGHMLSEQQPKIDSRNIYKNSYKDNKNLNSASLNLKKYVKKKDLHMGYPLKKEIKKKSQNIKLKSFQTNSFAVSTDEQFKSFMLNDQKMLVNSYFPNNSEFSTSFGSALYKPTSASIINGKKLESLKNCLVLNNTYSNKNNNTKSVKYGTAKTMK